MNINNGTGGPSGGNTFGNTAENTFGSFDPVNPIMKERVVVNTRSMQK
jgi:hypothetical protein